jgi:hypothetical protein
VNDAIAKIKASKTASDEYVQSLVKDLEDCITTLRDISSYMTRGTQQMATYSSSHTYQRATHSVQSYSNTTRRQMQQQVEDDF